MIFRTFWDFWTRTIRAEPLALFRILLGLVILASLLTGIFRTLPQTCGPEGMCPIEANDQWLKRQGGVSLLRGPMNMPLLGDWLSDDLVKDHPWLGHFENWLPHEAGDAWMAWAEPLSSHYLLFALLVLSLISLTLGFYTRLSAIAAVLLAGTFHHRLVWLMNGGDDLYRDGLYFLVLAPAGAVWSIDHWRRVRAGSGPEGAGEPVTIAPWSVRLMQIQVCCMYLFTGLVKLKADYPNGEALYWVLNNLELTRFSYNQVPIPLFLCRVMTWGTLTFELGFSLLVWIRPLRRWVLLAGLGLHLGIFLVMEIGWFSQVTLCWYVLFLSGESVSRFMTRLGAQLRGPAATNQPVPGQVGV
jgi:hypothetical protein